MQKRCYKALLLSGSPREDDKPTFVLGDAASRALCRESYGMESDSCWALPPCHGGVKTQQTHRWGDSWNYVVPGGTERSWNDSWGELEHSDHLGLLLEQMLLQRNISSCLAHRWRAPWFLSLRSVFLKSIHKDRSREVPSEQEQKTSEYRE